MLIAYGAGLATGLASFSAPMRVLWIGALLVGLVLLRRVDQSVDAVVQVVWLAVLLLGITAGTWAQRADAARCAARLPSTVVQLQGVLLEPTGLDDARVALAVPACGAGQLLARWPESSALAEGTPVEVIGRWLPRDGSDRPDGTLQVQSVTVRGPARPSFSMQLRGAALRVSHRLYGARAPLVDALILGRRGGMDRALNEAFAASGLVHILSISGFHVGVVVAWLVLLLRAAGIGQGRALLAASCLATLYVAWLGWEAPAARAASLAWLLAVARLRQRPTTDGTMLALTCTAVLLVDPWAIMQLGGWLSATALWGATRFGRWGDQATSAHWAWRSLWSSIGATLGTAPITAWALGAVAPIGILLNFPAVPLAALAVPGVAASLLLGWIPGLGEALAAGSGLALFGLERVALLGAGVPGGALVMEPGWQPGLVALGVLLVACWITAAGTRARLALRRLALIGTVASWLSLAFALHVPASDGPLRLFFLNVGQGDAAAVRTPHGRWLLIDAGPRDARLDAGASVVAPFLRRHGAQRLDLLTISHAHADHVGGAAAVLARVGASQVLEPAELSADAGYARFLEAVAASGARYIPAEDGQQLVIDGVRLRVLHPARQWPEWGLDLNEDSVVLLLEYGAFRAVFAGDAGEVAESRLAGRVGDVTLLKVGHHGSRTASGEAWLRELQPEIAVISVARKNRYGHPTVEALDRLRDVGARIRRTDEDGTITVETDGTSLHITGRSGTEHLPLSPSVVTP